MLVELEDDLERHEYVAQMLPEDKQIAKKKEEVVPVEEGEAEIPQTKPKPKYKEFQKGDYVYTIVEDIGAGKQFIYRNPYDLNLSKPVGEIETVIVDGKQRTKTKFYKV